MRRIVTNFIALFAAIALTMVGFSGTQTPEAEAAGARTTIFVSPHPDDEVLRGAGYINWAAGTRGDQIVLLAVTDGEATGMGKRDGLSPNQVKHRRVSEQEAAISRLTYNTGVTHRLHLPDGGINHDAVRLGINSMLDKYPGAEVYCASHSTDDTRDHQQVARGCRDSNANVVRYIKDPRWAVGCTGRNYPDDLLAATDSFNSYWWTLGPTSFVGSIRDASAAEGYSTCYTRHY